MRTTAQTLLPLAAFAAIAASAVLRADTTPDPAVLIAQKARVDSVERISAATVAVFDPGGQGGGSGVLISGDGFALTNFHVSSACGTAMKCGLSDGKLYDAVVVGVDPTGDVALIQLLGRDDFPRAQIGDSDAAEVGDWVFVVGNPFLLADDFRPTVTYGMLSGVHRYQYPAGTLLEYADCLQTDAAINPGNSGGPMFDAEGRLIGINGRGSFEKRGRVNVGVGYAISINQIMRFLPQLKSGRIVDHATLGATVATQADGRVTVDDILDTSDAFRRGLAFGDAIVRFAGRDIHTANALKNILGVFPSGWRVPVVFRREGKSFERQVRLMPLHDEAELVDLVQNEEAQPSEPREGGPKPDDGPKGNDPKPGQDPPPAEKPMLPGAGEMRGKAELPKAVADRYEARRGYANYWYNREAQQRIWRQYRERTSVEGVGYEWQLAGRLETREPFTLDTSAERARIRLPHGDSGALFTGDLTQQLSPPRSGGLLLAIHAWQRLMEKGLDRFGEIYYLGALPHGPENRAEDCLVALFEGMDVRFFFGESGDLTGIELFSADDADPCELSFTDFDDVGGHRLPRHWHVRAGEVVFAELVIESWKFTSNLPTAAAKPEN